MKGSLASDNWSPAHPSVMEAITAANQGFEPAYGSDSWTEKASALIKSAFQNKECKTLFTPTGTGANVLAFKLCLRPYESILCTNIAHVHYHESGATESLVGTKLLAIPHENGKVTLKAIEAKLKNERAFHHHSTSPRVLSITQPTEVGTVYTLEELSSLSTLCKRENLLLHIDGSRLYNAAVHLNVELSKLLESSQADMITLGGTKNGLMGAEALLIFNPDLFAGSDHLHKQMLQLPSKMRFLSAQFIPFFEQNLWHSLASNANNKAQKIGAIIASLPHFTLSYPVQTNQIFFTAAGALIPLIQEKISCHLWDSEKNELRFITSWNTTDEDVSNIESIIRKIAR